MRTQLSAYLQRSFVCSVVFLRRMVFIYLLLWQVLQYLIKFAWCFVSFWSSGLFSLLRVESSANPRVTDTSSGGRALDTSQAFQENQPRAASRRLSELLCWLISTPLASRGLFLSDMDSKWPQNLTLNWLFQSYHLNDCFLLSVLLRELIYR